MENNQEHKIDKIFKKSLENQPIIPPADAWTAVHTYTIGQEESKEKVWLKYVSLTLSVLLFLGLGWYYFNLDRSITQPLSLSPQTIFVKPCVETQTAAKIHQYTNPNVSKPQNLNSDKTVEIRNCLDSSSSVFSLKTRTLNKQNMIDQIIKIRQGSALSLHEQTPIVENPNNVENLNDSTLQNLNPTVIYQHTELLSKSYVSTDLSKKINEGLMGKIKEDYLAEKLIPKDSVVEETGKRFSLKHPIFSFGLGNTFSFWKINQYYLSSSSSFYKQPNYLYYKENDETQIRIGISWKLSKKARFGFLISSNKITLKMPFVPQPILSSSIGLLQPTANLVALNSDSFYQSNTVFGDVNIPIYYFKELQTLVPNKLDEIRDIVPFGSHIMTITALSLTCQYDIISKIRQKGKQRGYQLYGLTDFQIQRQTGYLYSAYNSRFSTSSLTPPIPLKFSIELNHLQNASEFIFSLRAGLGFRYQFAKKWDFYVEGSGQHSLNNWVKSDDIKTFQRSLSLQAGINLNL